MKPSLVLTMSVFLFTGCATALIPRDVREQANPKLTFEMVHKEPDRYKREKVLWGGQVISTKNSPEGTALTILQMPTDSTGLPSKPESSQGRFIAFAPEYLDPAIYKEGRKVSVFGMVSGVRSESLGEGQMTYRYPYVQAEKVYLWPEPENNGTPGGRVGGFWGSGIGVGVGVGF